MSNPQPEVVTYKDVRLTCPQCGRFLASAAIREEDYRDNGAYYGVSTRTWIDCSRCGVLEREPLITVVRELQMTLGGGDD